MQFDANVFQRPFGKMELFTRIFHPDPRSGSNQQPITISHHHSLVSYWAFDVRQWPLFIRRLWWVKSLKVEYTWKCCWPYTFICIRQCRQYDGLFTPLDHSLTSWRCTWDFSFLYRKHRIRPTHRISGPRPLPICRAVFGLLPRLAGRPRPWWVWVWPGTNLKSRHYISYYRRLGNRAVGNLADLHIISPRRQSSLTYRQHTRPQLDLPSKPRKAPPHLKEAIDLCQDRTCYYEPALLRF